MPTVNVYLKKTIKELGKFIPELKKYIAEQLTCEDIKLSPEEISIRFIKVNGGEMIGNVELEVTAHAFAERVEREDEICLNIMRRIEEKVPSIGSVKVWLKLGELGHSWKNS